VSYTVRAGGAILAFSAGITNAVAFHVLRKLVGHVTGTTAKIGLGWEDSAAADASDMFFLLLSFVLGSMFTGFLIAKDTMHFGMALYDFCLITESALLVCTALAHEHDIAPYLASAAGGLQNAMCTHWGGAVVRTTHVTGLFTDVGLLMGRMLSIFCRKRCGSKFDDFDRAFVEDDLSKLSALFSIALAYIIGVFIGAHLYIAMEHWAFLVPAGITGSIGLTYSVYRVFVLRKKFFSDEEMEVIDIPMGIQHELEELEAASRERANSGESKDSDPASSAPQRNISGWSKKSKASTRSTRSVNTQYGEVMCVSRRDALGLERTHRGLDLHHQQ
jgi:uncharacterized membrane protein YoaK (UPF0700 family)